MSDLADQSQVVVFGVFEVDLRSGELRKAGMRVHLPQQPFKALCFLLEHPQQIVTHEQLQRHLWPDSTVDYDLALKRIINRIRTVLGDSAETPLFVETIPRRGYRFIAPVKIRESKTAADPADAVPILVSPATSDAQEQTLPNTTRKISWKKIALLASAITVFFAITFSLVRSPIARFFNNRGVQSQQNGEFKMAIVNYNRALLLKSGYAEAHYNLADVYEEIPDYDKAVEEYKSAIEADITFYEAYNNLSRLYILHRKDYGAALRLLDHAMSFKPKEPAVQYSLYKNYGWAAFELNQMGQAQQSLRSAVALAPERGAAHCLLAKVLEGQGKGTDASPEWESCLADTSSDVEPEWRNEAQDRLRREFKQ